MKKKGFEQTKTAAESRRLLWAAMSEADFQKSIIEAAERFGWLVYHTHDSRRSQAGFPDLVMIHPEKRRLIVLEVKAMTTKVSREQRAWIEAWKGVAAVAGHGLIFAGVVRPRDQAMIDDLLAA